MKHHLKLRDWIDVDKLNWYWLSQNPNAIHLLERNFDKINWAYLSINPNAIYLLEQVLEANPDKIVWNTLSLNPNAIHLLEANLDKIDWTYLSENPNAIGLLEQNQDKINWKMLSQNPSIFEYDYQAIKDHLWNSGIVEELMAKMFHPDNIRNGKVGDWGFEDMLPPNIVKD